MAAGTGPTLGRRTGQVGEPDASRRGTRSTSGPAGSTPSEMTY
jgi:hypothetical protein